MNATIKNNISFDFGDYSIMVNGQKAGVLLSNEKEKSIALSDDTPSEIFLRFNMLPTSNKITLTPKENTTLSARRNIPVNILGYMSFLLFFVTLGDYFLTDSLWRWPLILFSGLAGLFLGSWKKLEIANS
jgi:hypothetical protein